MMQTTVSTHNCTSQLSRGRHAAVLVGGSRNGVAINLAHQPHFLTVSSGRPQHRLYAVAEGKQVIPHTVRQLLCNIARYSVVEFTGIISPAQNR